MPERFSVIAFHLWPTIFAGAPFRLQNICRNGVPPRSRTTTPLLVSYTIPVSLVGLGRPRVFSRPSVYRDSGIARSSEQVRRAPGLQSSHGHTPVQCTPRYHVLAINLQYSDVNRELKRVRIDGLYRSRLFIRSAFFVKEYFPVPYQ